MIQWLQLGSVLPWPGDSVLVRVPCRNWFMSWIIQIKLRTLVMFSCLTSHACHLAHLLRLFFVCAGDESCSLLYDDREVLKIILCVCRWWIVLFVVWWSWSAEDYSLCVQVMNRVLHCMMIVKYWRLFFVCAGDESCSSLYDDREVKYCTGELKALLPS